jgi:hypothetical protein
MFQHKGKIQVGNMTIDNRDGNEGTILKRHSDGTVKLQNDRDEIFIIIDGEGSGIVVGTVGNAEIPRNMTLQSIRVLETSNPPIAGSIEIDLWKGSSYPATSGDSIIGTNPVELITETDNTISDLTGYDVDFAEGESLGFNVVSNDGCRKIMLILKVVNL